MVATRYWALGLPVLAASILGPRMNPGEPGGRSAVGLGAVDNGTCVECHAGIEDMHPGFPLTCAECHGGDDTQSSSERAHVAPRLPVPTDGSDEEAIRKLQSEVGDIYQQGDEIYGEERYRFLEERLSTLNV